MPTESMFQKSVRFLLCVFLLVALGVTPLSGGGSATETDVQGYTEHVLDSPGLAGSELVALNAYGA